MTITQDPDGTVTVEVEPPADDPQPPGNFDADAYRAAIRAEVLAEHAQQTADETRAIQERHELQWQAIRETLDQQSSATALIQEQLLVLSQQTPLVTEPASIPSTLDPKTEEATAETLAELSTDPLLLIAEETSNETQTEASSETQTEARDESEGESLEGVEAPAEAAAPRRRVLMY